MPSIQSAAELYDAKIIAITETQSAPPKIYGYCKWFSKQRKKRPGGGVAITVRNYHKGRTTIMQNMEDTEQ